MSNRSMQDLAFDTLKKKRKPLEFKKLWEEVSKELGLNGAIAQSKMVKFYNSLSLDARFYQLSGNNWDLASRHSLEQIRNDKKRFDDVNDDDDENEYDDEVGEIDDDFDSNKDDDDM